MAGNQVLSFEEYMCLVKSSTEIVQKEDWIVEKCRYKTVLDVGCIDHSLDRVSELGESWLHVRICRVARKVVGVDLLENAAKELQSQGYNILVADAQFMSLGEKFDCVVLGDIIEHVENPGMLLSAAASHLTTDGMIILSTPNPFSAKAFITASFRNFVECNEQHVAWFDPRVIFRMADRLSLAVVDFRWIATRYKAFSDYYGLKGILARLINRWLEHHRPIMRSDFLVVLKNKDNR